MIFVRSPPLALYAAARLSTRLTRARACTCCVFADKIRAHYEKLLQSDVKFERQCGTAMWVIDRLALRVGGEKDEVRCCCLVHEFADTSVCTLW
ncbi:hypothetical protein EON66_03240 [archaeon]|nr:MAG: hypothetical protein EON66_03240 [archaeon]